jgi:hypothetical protein
MDMGYRTFWINGFGKMKACNAIAEIAIGKPLPQKALVHHVNNDRADDTNSNLVVCEDRKYHNLLHRRTRALKESGNPHFRKCWICKKWDNPSHMILYENKDTYIHSSCAASYLASYRKSQTKVR